MTVNISLGRLLMKPRSAGVACGSCSTRLRLLAASSSTLGVSSAMSLSDRTGGVGGQGILSQNRAEEKCIGNQKLLGRNRLNRVRKWNPYWLLKYYTITLILLGKSTCRYLKRTLTWNKVRTDDIVGEVSIYHMTRLFQVQCNFSASFHYIKLRNFCPKARAKIGVTMFIKFYRSNDCKSMVCVQYDIPGVFSYVKARLCTTVAVAKQGMYCRK